MAEVIIDSDSPLGNYLNQQQQQPSSSSVTMFQQILNWLRLPITITQPFLIKLLTHFKNLYQPIQSEQQTQQQQQTTTTTTTTENQLSERLKYLICSSFLLNPDIQTDFYPTSTNLSHQQHHHQQTTNDLTRHSITSFRFFRPHPRIILSLSTILILISYHLSPRWVLFSLPIILLTLFRPRTTTIRHIDLIPHLQPRSLQLQIQSSIIPEIVKLVNNAQSLDLRISRAIGAVKEIECVALGLGLSNPMPPVSRLETATFPFNNPTSTTPEPNHLHALGVRKVLQRVLDQARHQFENTAVELESVITSISPGNSDSSTGSSTLLALMEMYGCSRLSPQESQSTLRASTTERARRQAWRASLHSRIQDTHHLNSPPSQSKPISLQTPSSPSPNSTCDSHLAHLETNRKLSPPSSRGSRSRHSLGTPSSSQLNEYQLRSIEAASPLEGSNLPNYRRSPSSRPVSFHLSHSPTPTGIDGRRSSLLIPIGRSPKPRPSSMSATSFRTLTSSSPISHARPSPEFYPEINLLSSPTNPSEEPGSPPIERVIPFSLVALQNTFERMHISRKRLMCCLLALDFTLFTPNTLAMWQDTLETLQNLLKTIDSLSGELTAGMTVEFGPGSFETTPVDRSSSRESSHPRHSTRKEIEEDGMKSAELRDFGPPIPEADKRAKRQGDLLNQMQLMDLALRSISAKMRVCVEELEKENQHHGDSHGQRAISVHESIRADLESLAREWDESRSKIRTVVEGEKVVTPGRSRLRPHSLDSNEGSLCMSSGRASSIYSSEALTPVGEHGPAGLYESEGLEEEEAEDDESGPLLASTTRAPPPGLEELLAGAIPKKTDRRSGRLFDQPPTRGSETRTSIPLAIPAGHVNHKALKLSAEEQLELTRRRRESASFLPRSRPHSYISLKNPLSTPSSSSIAAVASQLPPAQTGVVTELKDVLHALKTRRASSIDSY